MVEEFGKGSWEREGVDGHAGSGSGEEKWSRVWKDGVKGRLRVKEIERSTIGGAGGAGVGEGGSHGGREKRNSRNSIGRTESELVDLVLGKEGQAIGGAVSQDVSARRGAQIGKFLGVEIMEIIRSGDRVRWARGGGWSGAGQAAGNVGSRRRRRVGKSLGKSKPEIEGEGQSGNPVVHVRRVNSGTQSKTGDARRASGSVVGDGTGDGSTVVVAKAKSGKIIKLEKAERIEVQQLTASRVALCELPGTCPKAAINSAELKRDECSMSKSERKSKQRLLRSKAAWMGGAEGTSKSMAFADRPSVKGTKALDDVVAAVIVLCEWEGPGVSVFDWCHVTMTSSA